MTNLVKLTTQELKQTGGSIDWSGALQMIGGVIVGSLIGAGSLTTLDAFAGFKASAPRGK